MKKTTLAALAMSLCAATSAHAEKPTDPQTELIVNLAVTTASVDRCHFEIDSRIIVLRRLQLAPLLSTPSILALKAILIKKYDAALLALRGETVLIETRGTFARNHLCRQIFERRVCQS